MRALIFDVDGTIAETEELHRRAFNRAFLAAGLDHVWDETLYRDLLAVTGGKRRILRYFEIAGLPPDDALASQLHAAKNRFYAEAIAGGISPRSGVLELTRAARAAGLRLAIATTTSRVNLDALLASLPLPEFDVIVTAEDVSALKPDPEAYQVALRRLGLPAEAALAFEDSLNGLTAAVSAGLRTIVTPALYTAGQDFSAATMIVADLADFNWRRLPPPAPSAPAIGAV